MLKIKIHSIVDLITNSSTVIFIYQDSVAQAKELVAEVLKLAGSSKTPDDVFYYGVFCGVDDYLECRDAPDDLPTHADYKESFKLKREYMNDLIGKIMRGETKEPEWMEKASRNSDDFSLSTYLYLIPKSDEYSKLSEKIKSLLGSVSGDGVYDG